MARYEITGGARLEGSVTISGAKNAAVAILPAALLVNGQCRIENVPDISDVRILLSILEGLGAQIQYPEKNVVIIDCTTIHSTVPDADLVKKMRASYYLMGALLGRFGHCHVAHEHLQQRSHYRHRYQTICPQDDEHRHLPKHCPLLLQKAQGPKT